VSEHVGWWYLLADLLFLYLSTWLIKKFLVAEVRGVHIKEKMTKLENKQYKTLNQQMKYLSLKRKHKRMYPFKWSALLIHLGAILLYLAMLNGKTAFDWRVGTLVIPVLTAGAVALFQTENYVYHYITNAAYSIFIITYVTIQFFNPLFLFGVHMNILLLLPMLFVASIIMKYITKKFWSVIR